MPLAEASRQRLAEGLARVIRTLSAAAVERTPLINTPIVPVKSEKPVIRTGKVAPQRQGIDALLRMMRRANKPDDK